MVPDRRLRMSSQHQALLMVGGSVTNTWNPADKDADVVLSGGNLTATVTQNGTTFGAVRAITPRNASDDRYFEVTVSGTATIGGFGGIPGLMGSTATLANHPGVDASGFGYYLVAPNLVYNNNIGATAFPANSAVNGYLIDFTNGLFYIRRGAGGFYQAAYSSGISSASIAPMWGSATAAGGNRVGTLNATGPFALGLPEGATAWGGTWNSADKAAVVTLSGSDLIATVTGSTGAVRGTQFRSAGLYYYEITESGADQLSGAGTSAANLATYPGASGGADRSWAYYTAAGQRWTNGSGSSLPALILSGTVGVRMHAGNMSIIVDNLSNLMYNTLSGNYYPGWGNAHVGVGNYVATLNVGASAFVYDLPSGSTAWG